MSITFEDYAVEYLTGEHHLTKDEAAFVINNTKIRNARHPSTFVWDERIGDYSPEVQLIFEVSLDFDAEDFYANRQG
jgi:hypothetical protein